jgi:fibronectin-binding autotransporter adhesin
MLAPWCQGVFSRRRCGSNHTKTETPGYAHEVLDANRALSVSSQDGTLFTAPGTSLPRGYPTLGVSLSMQPMKNVTISLGYDALINTAHASAQAGTLKVNYRF